TTDEQEAEREGDDLKEPGYHRLSANQLSQLSQERRENLNCSSIQNLELQSLDAFGKRQKHIIVTTELCAFRIPGLQGLEIHVADKDIAWDESHGYNHPDWTSPLPMYRALERLVQRISWLRVEKYDTDYREFRFQDDDAIHKMEQLEELVKARARAEEKKVAEKGERDGLD
ncbi:MAG: hypothetical protein L6R42_010611, partial [Xanthoria sp. 1 TBL-2021]